jgi:hypothetical protein
MSPKLNIASELSDEELQIVSGAVSCLIAIVAAYVISGASSPAEPVTVAKVEGLLKGACPVE